MAATRSSREEQVTDMLHLIQKSRRIHARIEIQVADYCSVINAFQGRKRRKFQKNQGGLQEGCARNRYKIIMIIDGLI